jgi:hypothetical protein
MCVDIKMTGSLGAGRSEMHMVIKYYRHTDFHRDAYGSS